MLTIGNSNIDTSANYEPVRDDEFTHTPCEAQAAYEIPERSGAQSIHTQHEVRIMKRHKILNKRRYNNFSSSAKNFTKSESLHSPLHMRSQGMGIISTLLLMCR